MDGQIGLEINYNLYINNLVSVFHEVRRVLKDDGTLWLNLGDSYSGSGKGASNYPQSTGEKQLSNKGSAENPLPICTDMQRKNLLGIPWKVAFALQSDGWILRQDIIWHKTNPMPESVRDRCTKSHEYIFLMTKQTKYYFDNDAIKEPISKSTEKRVKELNIENQLGSNRHPRSSHPMKAVINSRYGGKKYTENPDKFYRTKSGNMYDYRPLRNKRDVWEISAKGFKGAHFATFSEELITPCILAGCPEKGIVLDPFMGSGTTGVAAIHNNRNYVGIELNPEYVEMAEHRIDDVAMQILDEYIGTHYE
ncbi:hypothetical protein AB840_10105 [Megasphaera cerevisiae DSM 20462]|uniref:Methyltransferase n=2 Tax=Megasphaera TaxID=906 RepID=A0A0J6ZMH5_9FIRM|nr:hypothetical protein AB840_10105 [Megasphaera cerevisiae DSM 20462]